ncbi:unnamed protein product [Diatraea saccharalis]|uniref:Uncharacterized protein n=1 Tax=Diatraea saccharalis TaxID=40085 RepID=A0A9N9QTT8_9NEOP|nr:unnamed protein product [Diatraea saccharalis]
MALKPTTCKEAIARWEKLKGEVAADATVIELQFQWPPIEKMDGMRNLKILSLGRNYIKSLAGIECPALRDLVFTGNPLCDNQPDVDAWRTQASNRLQQITKLDDAVPQTAAPNARDNNAISEINTVTRAEQPDAVPFTDLIVKRNGLAADIGDLRSNRWKPLSGIKFFTVSVPV